MSYPNQMLSYAGPDPAEFFWSHPERWPIDAPDFVFLGRAVLQLGHRRLGEAWTDDLPATKWVNKLPPRLSLDTPTAEIWRAVHLLRRVCPSYLRRSPGGLFAAHEGGPEFPTQEEWAEAVVEMEKEATASWERLKKYLIIVFELMDVFARGVVATALRPTIGGEPHLQPWHFWNFEHAWSRFDTCRVARDDHFNKLPSRDGDWIFVDRGGLEQLLSRPRSGEPAAIGPAAVEQLRRRKSPGRPRGPQIDRIAGEYSRRLKTGAITDETSDHEVARQLSEWAAGIWIDPLEIDYIRKRVALWRAPAPAPEGDDQI